MEAAKKLEMVPPPKKSLVAKLAEIMGEVEHVAKRGRNENFRYDYATEADIAAAVRSEMAKRSVMLIPSVQATTWDSIPTKSGGVLKLCTLTVLFRLMDGDSDQVIEYTVLGQGSDSGDKATYKAMTGAEKYALLKVFLIPTGDDPEQDSAPAAKAKPAFHSKAEEAKVDTFLKGGKPGVVVDVAPGETEDEATAKNIRARAKRLFAKATEAGMDPTHFKKWCENEIKSSKPSKDWTAADLAVMEKELPQALMGLQAPKNEPGAQG